MAEGTGTLGSGSADTPEARLLEEWRDAAWNCFSSGHKFCREVCPVTQVTRDERFTPTAFHANVWGGVNTVPKSVVPEKN